MIVRKAAAADIDAVEGIYDEIHLAEEAGELTIGWARGVYPVRETAEAALERGELFVLEDEGLILGAGIINRDQVDVYALGDWEHEAADNQVCVLHTLVISPSHGGKGYGRAFLDFYECYARDIGCKELRIDTNERNAVARGMYERRGYREAGIVPTCFNGIDGVKLVLLEKYIGE